MRRSSLDAPEAPSEKHWYGWQTLLTDAAAIPLLVVPTLSLGVYAVGGPVVHVAHERPAAAVGSLGLRLGLPVVGAVVGKLSSGCHANDQRYDEGADCLGPVVGGLVLGAVAAIAIDASALSWESESPPEVTPGSVGFSFAIEPKRGEARVGVAGAF